MDILQTIILCPTRVRKIIIFSKNVYKKKMFMFRAARKSLKPERYKYKLMTKKSVEGS